MTMICISVSLGMARILGGGTLCLAVGTYTQGARDNHA